MPMEFWGTETFYILLEDLNHGQIMRLVVRGFLRISLTPFSLVDENITNVYRSLKSKKNIEMFFLNTYWIKNHTLRQKRLKKNIQDDS